MLSEDQILIFGEYYPVIYPKEISREYAGVQGVSLSTELRYYSRSENSDWWNLPHFTWNLPLGKAHKLFCIIKYWGQVIKKVGS